MTRVEEIKEAITHLSPQERAQLRAWYDEWEAEMWDKQIEEDVAAGRLDQLAEEALRAFRAGDYTEL